MKLIKPDYYSAFACVGGACPHNCCIGWEIDIDADSLAYYRSVGGPLGEKLRAYIATDACAHFALTPEDRCPFLDSHNLCEIISALGEEKLCQICRDHPRFFLEWSDRTECGLGLCCPTAAELILRRRTPVRLLAKDDALPSFPLTDDEAALLVLRDRLIALLQDRTRPVNARLESLLHGMDIRPPQRTAPQWSAFYRSLERLEQAWDCSLDRLAADGIHCRAAYDADFEIAREQLAVYLLYRHLHGALQDGMVIPRIAFAVHATQLLSTLAADTEQFIAIARLYSAEIEYSEENLSAVLAALDTPIESAAE